MYEVNNPNQLRISSNPTRRRNAAWFSSPPALLLFPTFLIVGMLIVLPMLLSLYASFTEYYLLRPDSILKWVGFENYRVILSDAKFWSAFLRTIVFLTLALNLEMLVGLGLALLVNRALHGKQVLRTILMFPMTFSPILVGYMFKYMFNDNIGVINNGLQSLGINAVIPWLIDEKLAFFSILLAEIWMSTSVFSILILAGLMAVPQEQLEASAIDGSNAWQTFRHIILPHIQPFILIAMTIRSLDVARAYDIVQVMTGGGPAGRTELLWTLISRTGYVDSRMGEANAMGFIATITSVLFTYSFYRQLSAARNTLEGKA
jgi:multiple sugar transport system permease protein